AAEDPRRLERDHGRRGGAGSGRRRRRRLLSGRRETGRQDERSDHRLPHQSVSPFAGDQRESVIFCARVWKASSTPAPVFALVRNAGHPCRTSVSTAVSSTSHFSARSDLFSIRTNGTGPTASRARLWRTTAFSSVS